MLQNMLEEFMTWYASLLQSLVVRKQDPDVINWQKLSDLEQTEWQRQRRQSKTEAKQRLKAGAWLVEQRDSGIRKLEDMSGAEQQDLEDYDTQKTKKRYVEICSIKPPRFSGEMH